jgi:rare lipoprotein A
LVVNKHLKKNTCFTLALVVIASVFFSFKTKNLAPVNYILNDSIKKDSVQIINDTVFKLLNNESIASYYSKKFIGRRTANGEKYDANAMTCAHKKLKFGTRLKVTNLKNNKSVIVTVNDRGPFVRNRAVDLSEKAFVIIANTTRTGIVKIKVEQILEILPKTKDTITVENELIIN